ncbi:Phosphoribosylglycinamide formyltransferase [Hartmannibacter diazotrophicus]|uniref:Phosphoribosylglycinamide formyltransferase n=1 Tax=Hartmannibacter diazotrophicus TaxID=1482074 RepID=A0A2C9D7L8_9HYPH|nr:phosphoribosylglycinamide formyltransferase [Hartmannibacter diazotrophicus]SON56324.1 Phosphoribosylglycinamide formyltransferase [Hartmannibacter diazotrophicus]
MKKLRIGILISGGGSNMAALVKAAGEADFPAEVAVVVSNRAGAGGLAKAEAAGIATAVIDHKAFPDREAFDAAIDETLAAHGVEFVCLAGFMRLLTEGFVTRWHNRMINIHPALLPLFKGLNTHQRALDAGVKFHGATVHFVRFGMDEGPIIAQGAVPVLASDDAATLAARVLGAEHRIYPLALRLVASGRARVEGEKVVCEDMGEPPGAMIWPSETT